MLLRAQEPCMHWLYSIMRYGHGSNQRFEAKVRIQWLFHHRDQAGITSALSGDCAFLCLIMSCRVIQPQCQFLFQCFFRFFAYILVSQCLIYLNCKYWLSCTFCLFKIWGYPVDGVNSGDLLCWLGNWISACPDFTTLWEVDRLATGSWLSWKFAAITIDLPCRTL